MRDTAKVKAAQISEIKWNKKAYRTEEESLEEDEGFSRSCDEGCEGCENCA